MTLQTLTARVTLFLVFLCTPALCVSLQVDLSQHLRENEGQRPSQPRKPYELSDEELDARPAWHSDFWQDNPLFRPLASFSRTVHQPSWNNDFRAEPRSRVLLYPARKLAFCYIEKNACTEFNHLFNKLNGFTRGDEANDPWWRSNMPVFGLDFSQTTRAEGWRWAVFLRDPLPRYLSAWGSKCVQREDDGSNCVPAGHFSDGSLSDFEDNVQQNMNDREPMAANPHWALQKDFCGGLNAEEYDFIGQLRGNVTAQVLDMMEMVGANESFVRSYVEEFFPTTRIAGHSTNLDPNVYYTKRVTQKRVKRMFKEDFALPGLLPSSPALGAQQPAS